MTIINLDYDLDDVSSSFEALPPDQYPAKLDKCTLVQSSKGNPMLKMEWVVMEGEYEGRRLYDNVVLSVAWKVKQYAEAAGIESGTELDTKDFDGMEAILDVRQREYNEEMRNEIKGLTVMK